MKRLALALALIGSLALGGCTSEVHLVTGSTVNIGETAELESLNADVVTTEPGQRLADELANLTSEQFYVESDTGDVVANEGFGTVTVNSTNPLTVTYEVATSRKWSDGQPVDSADLLLSYAAATKAGGTNFYSRRTGSGLQYAKVTDVGLRSITLQFSQPVSDWKTALRVVVPAHVVAAEALNGIQASAGKAAVIEAVQGADSTKLEALAEAYRSAYFIADGSVPKEAFVSDGAYSITKVVPGSLVELTANTKYQGTYPPVAQTVNVRLYLDSMAALSDMNVGNVDVISATESGLVSFAELVSMVPSLTGVEAKTALKNSANADMVLFNFGSGSLFSDAKLRKAFTYLVPKARIVQDANSSITITGTDSFVFPSGSDYYSSTVASNGSDAYLLQDVEKASELVAATEIDTPIDVRVVYNKDTPRSKAQFQAIAQRAASAGFNLIDISSADPSRVLLSGEFDVVIGPRPLVGIPGLDPQFLVSDRVTRYQDAEVAKLLVAYAKATKPIKQAEIWKQIDARLYATSYGLPLYQVPNLIIYNTELGNFSIAPFGDSATWGYWTWSVSAK